MTNYLEFVRGVCCSRKRVAGLYAIRPLRQYLTIWAATAVKFLVLRFAECGEGPGDVQRCRGVSIPDLPGQISGGRRSQAHRTGSTGKGKSVLAIRFSYRIIPYFVLFLFITCLPSFINVVYCFCLLTCFRANSPFLTLFPASAHAAYEKVSSV